MDKIFYNLDNPAGFGSVKQLHIAVKKNVPDTKRMQVTKFLQTSEVYTRHKQQRKKFDRRFYMVGGPGKILGLDTAHMTNLSTYNNNVKYLMFAIDLFSRFLIVIPMYSLKTKDSVNVFHLVMDTSIYQYPKFFTDEGVEFISHRMHIEYRKYSVEIYHTRNREIKCGVAERVIRTIKNKIYKYLTYTDTLKYIDVLDQIVDTYNITPHRGLYGRIPFDIHLMNNPKTIDNFICHIYKKRCSRIKRVTCPLDVDQCVRLVGISTGKDIFQKGFLPRNTREVFKITHREEAHIPITYTLSDLENKPIEGTWYHDELIPCSKPEIFKIEVIRSRKRNGIHQYLVKYIDYPESSETWITQQMLA
jgi:hypothetical protein